MFVLTYIEKYVQDKFQFPSQKVRTAEDTICLQVATKQSLGSQQRLGKHKELNYFDGDRDGQFFQQAPRSHTHAGISES